MKVVIGICMGIFALMALAGFVDLAALNRKSIKEDNGEKK